MRTQRTKILVLSLIAAAAGACGASKQPAPVAPTRTGPQIKLAVVYVDDQDKALRFYTEVLGFVEKDDVSNGPYRWLTVTAPGDDEGAALQLALDNDPAANALQEAMFQRGQPAVMFFTEDVRADYERIKARGAEFTMEPTVVEADSTIVMLKDTCGNLIQLTELAH